MLVRRWSLMMEDLSAFVSFVSASCVHISGISSATASVSPHMDRSLVYPEVLNPSLLLSISFSGVIVLCPCARLLSAVMRSLFVFVVGGGVGVVGTGDGDDDGMSCCKRRMPHLITSGCAFFMKVAVLRLM